MRLLEQAVLNQSVFMQEFSYQEREGCRNMAASLSEIAESTDLYNFTRHIDNSKALISRLRSVFGKQARASLLKEAGDISQTATEAKCLMDELTKERDRLGRLKKFVKDCREQSQENSAKIQELVESASNGAGSIEQSLNAALGTKEQMDSILQAVEASKQTFDGMVGDVKDFFDKVGARTQELAQQQAKTEEYERKLKEDEEMRERILKGARDALGLATAGGLTKAFTERVKLEQKRNRGGWLWGAGTCLALAVLSALELHTGIISTLLQSGAANEGALNAFRENTSASAMLAKIAVPGMFFIGTWFCASQYNKLSNVLEDYKYKQVLAQSMKAFIDNLSGNDENVRSYLFKLFEQMFQDPLRKGHDVSTPMTDLVKNILRSAKKGDGPDNPSGKG